MSQLADVIAELKAYGLLERASYVKAGDVEVHLGPPLVTDSPLKQLTREEEMNAVQETMYAASRGIIPGAS